MLNTNALKKVPSVGFRGMRTRRIVPGLAVFLCFYLQFVIVASPLVCCSSCFLSSFLLQTTSPQLRRRKFSSLVTLHPLAFCNCIHTPNYTVVELQRTRLRCQPTCYSPKGKACMGSLLCAVRLKAGCTFSSSLCVSNNTADSFTLHEYGAQ